ncbi:SCO family protein [Castellaniella sp.]|uniref:SCO family protein n=1 Tax=Castellaniella sp. TaxID=1955812 RepID=UPI002D7F3006|nr:SCO family protein [Castellaniella sp.]HET8703351.1 SCO family protein [Castellaniella sp.]
MRQPSTHAAARSGGNKSRLARHFLAGLALWAGSLGLSLAAVHPVRGFLPDLKFSLQGAGGTTVTQQAFAGKVVLMFFGYASCPDICPTTMAQLAQVTEALGPQADQVRILFVSVDPHRDTPDILQAYVDQFDPHAIGLTGDEKAIAALARRYRVAYQIQSPDPEHPDAPYAVAHSRGIYAFDQKGKAVWLAADGESQEELLAALKPLLH